MENIPYPDPVAARAALDDVAAAQRAVRDTPWPVWLYPVNALLLGALSLTALLGDQRSTAALAVSLTLVVTNLAAGYRMGTPYAVPTSRAFLTCVAASAACLVAALAAAELTDRTWPVVVLALGATGSYLVGAVFHRRSTAR